MPSNETEARYHTMEARLLRIETMLHILCTYTGINPITRAAVPKGTITPWKRKENLGAKNVQA
jgi:hypothetical protein